MGKIDSPVCGIGSISQSFKRLPFQEISFQNMLRFLRPFFQTQEPVIHDERPRIVLKKTKCLRSVQEYAPAEPIRFRTTVASIRRGAIPTFAPPAKKILKETESKVAGDFLGLFTVTSTVTIPSDSPTETICYKPQCELSEEMRVAQAGISVTLESMDSNKKIKYTNTVNGKNKESLSVGQEIEVSPHIADCGESFIVGWVLCAPLGIAETSSGV